MKDPAFLFYAKDFYEGTRTMLPKERACYIDLMIYQHQHGLIPNDIERLMMYCGGIDEATLKATLEAKFKQTDEGWFNAKLKKVVDERKEFSGKQSDNGLVGQFFKKAKAALPQGEYKKLRDYVYNVYTKKKLIESLKQNETTHEGLLKALLKHLAIVDADADVNKDLDDNEEPLTGDELLTPTAFDQFWKAYGKQQGRYPCEQLWRNLGQKDIEKILEHAPKFVKASGDYLINPEKYLKDRRWLDEELPDYGNEKPKDDRPKTVADLKMNLLNGR